MKKFSFLLVAAFVLFLTQDGFAQITGTAHDFTAAGWNSTGEICIVCHTPHEGLNDPDAPLWNHEVTTATYTLYSGYDMDAADVVQPDGASKLCLSCHDGSVALENFGGTTTGTNFIPAARNIGEVVAGTGDLSDDHPISFTYNDALATTDGGLHPPSSTVSGLPGGGFIAGDLLIGGKMQCSSCHDVHDGAGLGLGAYLLVKSNAGSDLCLTCHDK